MNKAMAGVEALASVPDGFKVVMEELNAAQYIVGKALLGAPRFASIGSRVAVLSETRILTRAGSEAAVRIVMVRARLSCLREDHPAALAAQGILESGLRGTWLDHSLAVMSWLGVEQDFWEYVDMAAAAEWGPSQRKGHLSKYKEKVVVPAMRRVEVTWFMQQLSRLNEEGTVNYSELVPMRQPWARDLRLAMWGRGRWRQFRAWCLARASGKIPLVVWGAGGLLVALPACPFCNCTANLEHFIRYCPGMEDLRSTLPNSAAVDQAAWTMRGVSVAAGLELRIQYFGRCMARLIAARRKLDGKARDCKRSARASERNQDRYGGACVL
jgi:hypothetical protein